MNRDPNEWESTPGDPFHSINREGWDEDDWEQFLLRQDALNAKYQELYETLRHHPERDEIIAREMNWNLPAEVDEADDLLDDDEDEGPDDLDLDLALGCDEESCEGCDAYGDEDDLHGLGDTPAYALAHEFADDLEQQFAPRALDRPEAEDSIAAVTRAAYDVSARIVNGHSIGYERETLCGNIACCRRALASLNECIDGLLCLVKDGICSQEDIVAFLRRGKELGDSISQRIEGLRSRVWWV